jgi:transcriptional regulator with XRE-family HTH domain
VSGNRKAPQARDRALGAQLKAIRQQQTNLSLEEAAKLVQWSSATMSRIENGKRHISVEEVATILASYKVPVAQRNALVAHAKAAHEPGWWARPLPGVHDVAGELATYENEAIAITNWSITLIPGLLQTFDYTKAVMLDHGLSEEDAVTRSMFRLGRQQVLRKVDFTAFIGEAAFHTPYGGATALIEQLRQLIAVTHRGIAVRMVPAHRPHPALMGSWMLLEFPSSPPVVHIELRNHGVYLHGDEVESYFAQRATLNKVALSTAETSDVLARLVARWETVP